MSNLVKSEVQLERVRPDVSDWSCPVHGSGAVVFSADTAACVAERCGRSSQPLQDEAQSIQDAVQIVTFLNEDLTVALDIAKGRWEDFGSPDQMVVTIRAGIIEESGVVETEVIS